MKEWIKVLSDREGLSEDEIHLLTDNQERKSFAKNEIVVHKEEIDSNVYIITKGIWRAYHFKYGEEATAWPHRENWYFPHGDTYPTNHPACRSNP